MKKYRVVVWLRVMGKPRERNKTAELEIEAESGKQAVEIAAESLGLAREQWDGPQSPEIVLRVEDVLRR